MPGRRADKGDFDSTRLLVALVDSHAGVRATLGAIPRALEHHDGLFGTDLLTTLKAFVKADGSTSETARVLGIHRHTVLNRLRLIEKVLGRSVRTGADRLVVELALLTYQSA
jgi:purine catabolism regulator